MKKIFALAAMASLLSGCQVLESIQGQIQKPSKIEEAKPAAEENSPFFQKLDAQFERVKAAGTEIKFNNETYFKQIRAAKGTDPRFISLAVSADRTNRKSISSDTIYLSNAALMPEITQNYLDEIKNTCDPMLQVAGGQEYYECSGKEAKGLLAMIYKNKNIVAFRSVKYYQQKPTKAEEQAVIKALVDYPLDTIAQ